MTNMKFTASSTRENYPQQGFSVYTLNVKATDGELGPVLKVGDKTCIWERKSTFNPDEPGAYLKARLETSANVMEDLFDDLPDILSVLSTKKAAELNMEFEEGLGDSMFNLKEELRGKKEVVIALQEAVLQKTQLHNEEVRLRIERGETIQDLEEENTALKDEIKSYRHEIKSFRHLATKPQFVVTPHPSATMELDVVRISPQAFRITGLRAVNAGAWITGDDGTKISVGEVISAAALNAIGIKSKQSGGEFKFAVNAISNQQL